MKKSVEQGCNRKLIGAVGLSSPIWEIKISSCSIGERSKNGAGDFCSKGPQMGFGGIWGLKI